MTVDASLLWQQGPIIQHTQRLLHSFYHWTGNYLLKVKSDPEQVSNQLFHAPFVVVSHDIQADPIFNYGNQVALTLWEMDWYEFTQTPSRQTAEPIEQADRDQLLDQAKTQGFIDNYQGIRISKTGRRFQIQHVLVWEVVDEMGKRWGQAATFDRWNLL